MSNSNALVDIERLCNNIGVHASRLSRTWGSYTARESAAHNECPSPRGNACLPWRSRKVAPSESEEYGRLKMTVKIKEILADLMNESFLLFHATGGSTIPQFTFKSVELCCKVIRRMTHRTTESISEGGTMGFTLNEETLRNTAGEIRAIVVALHDFIMGQIKSLGKPSAPEIPDPEMDPLNLRFPTHPRPLPYNPTWAKHRASSAWRSFQSSTAASHTRGSNHTILTRQYEMPLAPPMVESSWDSKTKVRGSSSPKKMRCCIGCGKNVTGSDTMVVV